MRRAFLSAGFWRGTAHGKPPLPRHPPNDAQRTCVKSQCPLNYHAHTYARAGQPMNGGARRAVGAREGGRVEREGGRSAVL